MITIRVRLSNGTFIVRKISRDVLTESTFLGNVSKNNGEIDR